MRPCLVGFVSVVAALIVLPAPTQAQQVSLGVTTGFTSSDFWGWRAAEWGENRNTVSVGVFLPIRILSFLIVQPEASSVRKGAQLYKEVGDTRAPLQSDLAFSYLEFPVLFRFNLPALRDAGWKPTVFLGPSFGFLLGCRWRFTEPFQSLDDAAIVNCKIDHCARAGGGACPGYLGPFDTTTQIDITALVGLGLARTLGRTAVHLDARYGLGMFGVDGHSPEFRHRTMALNVGVSYALQR